MIDLLADLNDAQREAAEHVAGPLLVLAGPGSGKTRVVTHRIAHLLAQGAHPREVLALTFTNKAADEMKARVERLVGSAPVWISTFHRFCARLLREYAPLVGLEPNFTIYDVEQSLSVVKRALEAVDHDTARFSPEQIARAIGRMKNHLDIPGEHEERLHDPLAHVAAGVFPLYRQLLLRHNAVDFDDLLLHVACLLADQPEVRATLDDRYRFVMVDEYQDTNHAQYAIVRALCHDHPNLAVTGDPDQSIYGWRGANLGNILDFERDYPGVRVVRLEQNYRSTPEILHVAATLIQHNQRRKHKELFTENPSGAAVRLTLCADHHAEAAWIAEWIAREARAGRRRFRDCAVFYRVNALSRALETEFRGHGVPYQIVSGVEFFQRKEIKDVVAYLQLLNNPRDDQALLRIINVPARGIGKTTLARLRDHADLRGSSLLDAARESGLVEGLPKRTAVSIAKFVALYDRLAATVGRSVEEIVRQILSHSGYEEELKASGAEEDQDRLANIQELITAALEYDHKHPEDGALEGFLEQVCLVNETDAWEAEVDRVTMMTLHAAKGLEFPVVFITALEGGLLPHERAAQDPAQLEEERRLLFVGITRAREELYLSLAKRRLFRGGNWYSVPSEFLAELPRETMQWEEQSSGFEFAPLAPREPRRPATIPAGAIVTAAQLAGKSLAARVAPEEFFVGQRVAHPEYGEGTITRIDRGSLHSALVEFDSAAGFKKFVLQHCALQPLDAG